MPTGQFDYNQLTRLQQKASALKKYRKMFKKELGKDMVRATGGIVKGLKKVMKEENDAEMKHKMKIVARNKYSKEKATPHEKDLDRAIRFIFPKGDPRRKEFEL